MSKWIYMLNPTPRRRGRRRTHRKARLSNPVKTRKRRPTKRTSAIPTRRRNPVGRRRGGRRGSGMDPLATAKQLVNKDTLMVAGGAVLGGLATSFVMSRFGPVKLNAAGQVVPKAAGEFKLPGSDQKYGPMLYSLLIPVAGAWALHRQQPKLAQGIIIGGAVLLIQHVVSLARGAFVGGRVAGTNAYLNAGGTLRSLPSPCYSGVKAFSGGSLDSAGAFRSNTWAIAK